MKWIRFTASAWAVVVLALTVSAAEPNSPGQTNAVVRLPGRVLVQADSGTNLVFKTETGKRYKLLRNPASEALFADTNLLSKELLLTGKVRDKAFEVTGNLRSIKDGKVHELYYYCSVCSIKSSAPGLCQCCREPSELVEEPEP